MNNIQLYLAIGVPILFNGLIATLLMRHIDTRADLTDKLFAERLRRVEDVLDARLKNLEERMDRMEQRH